MILQAFQTMYCQWAKYSTLDYFEDNIFHLLLFDTLKK